MRSTRSWTAGTRASAVAGLLLALLLATGCGGRTSSGGDPPTSGPAKALWDKIKVANYDKSWAKAPGYDTAQPAKGPHGVTVRIYLDPIAAEAEKQNAAVYPPDAVIVKDALGASGAVDTISAMTKQADGKWFWSEYRPDGSVIADGVEAPACATCHKAGKDFVRGFDLTK
jgi:hypothetical protein